MSVGLLGVRGPSLSEPSSYRRRRRTGNASLIARLPCVLDQAFGALLRTRAVWHILAPGPFANTHGTFCGRSVPHGKQPPGAGHALEFVLASVDELDVRSRHKVLHR
jgi:hypothetical protein